MSASSSIGTMASVMPSQNSLPPATQRVDTHSPLPNIAIEQFILQQHTTGAKSDRMTFGGSREAASAAASSSMAASSLGSNVLLAHPKSGEKKPTKIPEIYMPSLHKKPENLPKFHMGSEYDLYELHGLLDSLSGQDCLYLQKVVINLWQLRKNKSDPSSIQFMEVEKLEHNNPMIIAIRNIQLKKHNLLKMLNVMQLNEITGFKDIVVRHCSSRGYFEA